MADANEKPRPFDLRTIRYLVRLMSSHDLSEIDLSEGDQRIRLRRGPRVVAGAAVSALPAAAPPAAPPALPADKPAAAAAPAPARKLTEIKSVAVGTFYSQKDPTSPPFVKVGSRVGPDTVVGVLEAMKVFTDILAECSGVIVEVCVKNQAPIEFNTVLFRVDPEG